MLGVDRPAAYQSGPTAGGPAPGQSLVLVIEDEAVLALELEQLLTDAGYAVAVAADGAAALSAAALSEVYVAAAVVDLRLHGSIDGRDVIRRLRERMPGLPVLVLTGFDPLAPEANLRGVGGPTARLIKPVEGACLLRRLRKVMMARNGVG